MMCFSRFIILQSVVTRYLFVQKVVNCCYIISSPYVHNQFARTVSGAVVKNLNKDKVKKIFIPLPPLVEQYRIVARIEELQPDIDAYDKAQTELRTIEQRFPDDMKKSLLQYAIEGKLVPQRKEEGTARDLLAEIRAEKEKLIKEKKSRRPSHCRR